jgi:hypothetical protein
MSTTQGSYRADPELRARIQAFSPDEPGVVFPFSARLAEENGWTREHARRVTREYLRFVYLAMTAGHPVTPSLAVDEAWHLHLTYTRSYWEEMCGRVLGRPLHHEPTRGGTDEEAKFAGWYARTLAAYRAAFGEEPPAAIWPKPRAEAASPPAAPATDARKRTGPALFAGALLAAVATSACAGADPVGLLAGMLAVGIAGMCARYVMQERARLPRREVARNAGSHGAGAGGGDSGGMWLPGGTGTDGGGDGGGHLGQGCDGHGGDSGNSGCSGDGGCGDGGSGCGSGSGCGGGGGGE